MHKPDQQFCIIYETFAKDKKQKTIVAKNSASLFQGTGWNC